MNKLTASALTLLVCCAAFCGCKKKSEPLPPPTPEAIAAFDEAAFNGDAATVSAALAGGMPVDQLETNGNSALMLASFDGHIETMQVLLDAGADINLRDSMNRTPLMFAASGPYPAAVRLLIAHGADINAIDKDEHFTALMFAAGEGLSPVVDILLAAGADPKLKDEDGDTAASFARQRGFTALADKLQALIDAP
jgi:uncharacterized protein